MSNSVLNNVSALGATRELAKTSTGMAQTIKRLTTGKRINQASDDAAGLGISNKLGADIRVANQAKRNANDGVSYLQVADGVLDEVTSLLTRASELVEQAKTGTISNTNRTSMDAEFQNIIKTIGDIGQSTKFNGAAVFSSTAVSISVGSYTAVAFTVGTISSSGSTAFGLTASTNSLTTTTNASTAAGLVDSALESVSNLRATIGSYMSQLNSVSNALGIQVENVTNAYSQITDAVDADEVVNLTKFQILNQSGTSALSQANSAQQQILSLLR